jgi:cysteine desulfurase
MAAAIYLDNHATTRVDPRVVEAMEPYFSEWYGNAGSVSHAFGREAREAVERARSSLAAAIGVSPDEVVFTSGATESVNLALRGFMERRHARGRHVISVATEHRAVLDPLARLARTGFEVTFLPVRPYDEPDGCGMIRLDQLADALRPDTQLVSVMLANNEIGVIQPLAEIVRICHERGVMVHSDATQAVGKIPVNVAALDLDMMSFSAHKLYGPKGIGALVVRRRSPPVRLTPLIEGGGQEKGMRSGTLPVPLIVGFARAVEICQAEMSPEAERMDGLRARLFAGLTAQLPGCQLNGPSLAADCPPGTVRLPNNLNFRFAGLSGESLMLGAPQLAVSSGSACSAASPQPSHVLRAIGLSDDDVRSSLRFGLGRFNTPDDVDRAVAMLSESAGRLRSFSTPPRSSGSAG